MTEYLRTSPPELPVRDVLIRGCQYLIGKFDVDGYRIDTLMYVERDFARTFGSSQYPGGVLAYSRILDDREVVVVANASTTDLFPGFVHVDPALSRGRAFGLLYANQPQPTPPGAVVPCPGRFAVPVRLRPMEVQILG